MNKLNSAYKSIGEVVRILELNDNNLTSIPESLCNLNDLDFYITLYNNYLCNEFHYSCFENFENLYWNYQNQEDCP